MPFSAIIPVASANVANAALDARGFGPNNFSVPLRTAGATQGVSATHAALHSWDSPAFQSAVASVGAAVDTAASVQFAQAAQAASLEWTDTAAWFQTPVAVGAQRSHAGKTWQNFVEGNPWTPPVGWIDMAWLLAANAWFDAGVWNDDSHWLGAA